MFTESGRFKHSLKAADSNIINVAIVQGKKQNHMGFIHRTKLLQLSLLTHKGAKK